MKTVLCLHSEAFHVAPLIRSAEAMAERGIEMFFIHCDSPAKACQKLRADVDVILIHQVLMCEEIIGNGVPVIILERIDGAQLAGSRPWLPHVAGVIKGYVFRERSLNNFVSGRAFTRNLVAYGVGPSENTRAFAGLPAPQLSQEDLDKIHVGYGFSSYDMMGQLIADTQDMLCRRPLDLHWVGTVEYQGTEIELHRRMATQIAEAWPGPKVVGEGRPHVYPEYKSHLRNTSCVLSPWGWGEPCFRDVEAWLSGAVLVKPDTDYVESWPDMYRNGITYRACRPDLSDVHEIVADVIERWEDHLPMRLLARKLCIEAWQPEAIAKHIVETIQGLLQC